MRDSWHAGERKLRRAGAHEDGFGAFSLAVAIFVAGCAISARTLRAGLAFVLDFDLTSLAVRLHAVLSVGDFAADRGPFIGEIAFGVLALSALVWQTGRLRRSGEATASVL